MIRIGTTELIIILVLVILFFGVGRISNISGEVGTAIRKFREGLKGDEKDDEDRIGKSDNTEDSQK